MTSEQDFESLTRLKELSTLAPALALLAGGLTSSVWLGYRFLHDRRWNRQPSPRPEVPPPPAEAEATAEPVLAAPVLRPTGAPATTAEKCRGDFLHSPTAILKPSPNGSRAADVLRATGPGLHRKKQTERRANVRRAGMTVPVRVATGGLRLDEMDGAVVDRSQGGLCLDLPGPLQEGQAFRLRSLLYDDMTPWVEVEACSVRPSAGRWLVGCRFTSPLPWNLLLLFG